MAGATLRDDENPQAVNWAKRGMTMMLDPLSMFAGFAAGAPIGAIIIGLLGSDKPAQAEFFEGLERDCPSFHPQTRNSPPKDIGK